jgi:hypothetical protein
MGASKFRGRVEAAAADEDGSPKDTACAVGRGTLRGERAGRSSSRSIAGGSVGEAGEGSGAALVFAREEEAKSAADFFFRLLSVPGLTLKGKKVRS